MRRAQAHILTRGVLAETVTLDELRRGFLAVVDVDLRKDLSQRKIIRGPDHDGVLDAIVQAHARAPALARHRDAPLREDRSSAWLVVLLVALLIPLLWLLVVIR